jgi:hypothetical protein
MVLLRKIIRVVLRMFSKQKTSQSLTTSILNESKEPMAFTVVEEAIENKSKNSTDLNGVAYTNLVSFYDAKNQEIGYSTYNVYPTTIYVRYMRNISNYTHVGKALHEWIFRKSVELGRGGNVSLTTIPEATGFHFSWGFRFSKESYNKEVFEKVQIAKETGQKALDLRGDAMTLPPEEIIGKKTEYKIVDPTLEDFEERKHIKIADLKYAEQDCLEQKKQLLESQNVKIKTAERNLFFTKSAVEPYNNINKDTLAALKTKTAEEPNTKVETAAEGMVLASYLR